MLNYTEYEIKQILEEEFGKKLVIQPIGNHELGRHLVYKVNNLFSYPVVLKLFCKDNRINREISSLKLLANSTIKVPKLLYQGTLKEGTEWIIINYLEGKSLHSLYNLLDESEKIDILYSMGEELGKIHNNNTFDFFGNWNRFGDSTEIRKDFKSVFKKRVEITIENLLSQDLPHIKTFNAAISTLRNSYYIFSDVRTSRLCHNDYDGRNILVAKKNDNWIITGVIDFEQSIPWDIDYELSYIHYRLKDEGVEYLKSFIDGYKSIFDYNFKISEKARMYLLYKGIEICSWSYEIDKKYYLRGLKIIKNNLQFS
ncbi:aminoglycoside phosphotransferase family protein [Clostridium sp. D2Q-11]|uniref:Aminoglycoside phosphotransferase family protein n=1 Tax=Anaeromonas frigoriresistens TaxID=2683708 RepID=A0A942UZ95_9FIRM|nr:aminoglycoside phosphotransferase family protein [Anaeromonas frigoriresistens]MBS4537197.1 aminoglycoside phosphotransferase family protein [Anaeromonas frigoriresistens]